MAAAAIEVERIQEGVYRVRVREGSDASAHVVSVRPDYEQTLAQGRIASEELLRRSFEFLLARGPKESILAEFDHSVIQHYFPEYEKEIRRRLAR